MQTETQRHATVVKHEAWILVDQSACYGGKKEKKNIAPRLVQRTPEFKVRRLVRDWLIVPEDLSATRVEFAVVTHS